MSTDDSKKYPVGYRNPPLHTRFRAGVSGNPSGKTRGTLSFRAGLERELNSPIEIKEGGKRRKVTKRLALAKQYLHQALQGDDRAFARILPLVLAIDGGKEVQQAARELSETEALILKRNARRLLTLLAQEDDDE